MHHLYIYIYYIYQYKSALLLRITMSVSVPQSSRETLSRNQVHTIFEPRHPFISQLFNSQKKRTRKFSVKNTLQGTQFIKYCDKKGRSTRESLSSYIQYLH